MKRLSILASMLAMACLPMMAQKTGSKVQEKPDPNFQIYLCFGQSNMEGNAAIEDIDRTGVNPRFQAMYAVDDEKAGWKKGQWHTAVPPQARPDRKSTRLNSSHVSISYAVFCLKKKKKKKKKRKKHLKLARITRDY